VGRARSRRVIQGRITATGLATDWIICEGAQRDVTNGMIACPLRKRLTALETCLECRHLTWISDERDRFVSCSIEEIS
jgi:hypothetical protein